MGLPAAGLAGSLMGGHQLIVPVKEADLAQVAADPQLLFDQPIGGGVVTVVKLDIAIPA